MRTWALLLGGLVIWAVHFFTLYIVASVFLTTPLARILTLLITLACFGAIGLLALHVRRIDTDTGMDRWVRTIALLGLGVSGVAILWQGLPALLV
ncbi:hypothetical protein [Sphingomonas turrisvirgatae]|uniref:Major facilitator superfamily (MFS) profile domain-containing protein n=1 Tax=Sphingomonas turrisvirgatae TaxID=1888892 RepID=A0A1E3LVM8_9SPHN|nr:hypothetical protein [Sphingomonas turrisvirgatae]ODP37185.1 hypothetical protein BFL28_02850 [Sphingomonas turrisvirgatae]